MHIISLFILLFLVGFAPGIAKATQPEERFYSAEVSLDLPPLPQETLKDKDAYVHYALSQYIPEDLLDYDETQIMEYLDWSILQLLETIRHFPDEELPMDRLEKMLSYPDTQGKKLPLLLNLQEEGLDSLPIRRGILKAFLEIDDLPQASKILRELLADHPDDPELLCLQAQVAFQEKDNDMLDNALQQAMANPEAWKNPCPRILYLRRLIQTGQRELASEITYQLASDDEFMCNPEEALDLISKYLEELNCWHVLSDLVTSIVLHNLVCFPPEELGDLTQLAFHLALAAEDYDTPAFLLENILDILKREKQILLPLLSNLVNLTDNYTQNLNAQPQEIPGNLIHLNIHLEESLLNIAPFPLDLDDLHERLAEYLLWDEQYEDSLNHLLEIRAPNPETRFKIAVLLQAFGRSQEALPRMRELAEEFSDNLTSNFYLDLGSLEDTCGNSAEAEEALRKALALDPGNDRAANHLGYNLVLRGENLNEAEKLIRAALAKEPDSFAYLDSLAWLRYRQGRNRRALLIIAKAIWQILRKPDEVSPEAREEIFGHARDILKALLRPFCEGLLPPMENSNGQP